ncbi:MAG: type V CRISPR-associated protein Cas12b, partial [Candidatus Hadarchaeales archaeon]
MTEVNRSYTIKLSGLDGDDTWRDDLWSTHVAVNRGVKAFGDWLLAFKGGLSPSLANVKPKKVSRISDESNSEERKWRRVVLALSWLSVESEEGAPERFIVAKGSEDDESRSKKVLSEFKKILKKKGVKEEDIDSWVKDCRPSLESKIRKDSVWVNRYQYFLDVQKKRKMNICEQDIDDFLFFFISKKEYFKRTEQSEGQSDEAARSPDNPYTNKARKWLSIRFGSGEKTDFEEKMRIYSSIANFAGKKQESMRKKGATSMSSAVFFRSMSRYLREEGFGKDINDADKVLSLLKANAKGRDRRTEIYLKKLREKSEIEINEVEELETRAKGDAERCRQEIGTRGEWEYARKILEDIESHVGFSFRGRDTEKDRERDRIDEYSEILAQALWRVSAHHSWIKRAEELRQEIINKKATFSVIPEKALKWLRDYCEIRTEETGAIEGYRIRRRAIKGWDEIVSAWAKKTCVTYEDRLSEVKRLQDELDDFGDSELFAALASDDAMCVWHKDGDPQKGPDPKILINYVKLTEAEYNERRYKIPSYRHPDPLLHPVFCNYGKSRWGIEYEICDSKNRKGNLLKLTVYNGKCINKRKLKWSSKRFGREIISFIGGDSEGGKRVTRANRLSIAAAGETSDGELVIDGVSEKPAWGARLEAHREQLEEIARRVGDRVWDDDVKKLTRRINWFMTISVRLIPKGPCYRYSDGHGNPFVDKRGKIKAPFSEEDRKRGTLAKIRLARLPGLRVLAVDLGHRYAAACAVWQTLSKREFKQDISGREIILGGTERDDLFCITSHYDGSGKEKKTVYRRIGPDRLNGDQHPAPWARLERQFLIKLQGEEEGPRLASNEEIYKVHCLEEELGVRTPLIDRLIRAGWGKTEKQKRRKEALKRMGWVEARQENVNLEEGVSKPSLYVDELIFEAVDAMRKAVKVHGDRARIAIAMDEGMKEAESDREKDEKMAKIARALLSWKEMFESRVWNDKRAKELWDKHIAKLTSNGADKADDSEKTDGSESRKKKAERLLPIAEKLLNDKDLMRWIRDDWKKYWDEEDKRWKRRIREVRDWIVPRGIKAGGKGRKAAIYRTGGLTLARIATLTEFRRRVQVGYFTRLRPDGTREELGEEFGKKLLDDLEEMREQRVKQLASRIVEAALGIGTENKSYHEGGKRPAKPIEVEEFAPCHAIVIENLEQYRPDEERTRMENRRIAEWSARRLREYLKEACELNGIYLCEVSANFTSRQDSRTGVPGIR